MTREEFDTELISHGKVTMLHFQQIIEKTFSALGLTPPQGAILRVLRSQGEQPLTSLSQQLHVTKGSLSGLCKRMESQGLILRRRSKEDERFVYISMTPKGMAMMERLEKLRANFYAHAQVRLDDASRDEILRGLMRLESYASQSADELTRLLEEEALYTTTVCLREEATQ